MNAAAMRQVDDRMENEFGISLVQMMENAGRSLAWLALDRYAPKKVVVLASGGGNGGGGLAAARHLANHSVEVSVGLVVAEQRLGPVPAQQLASLRAMGVPIDDVGGERTVGDVCKADLIIDAMIGYSLAGNPRDGAAKGIQIANEVFAPVLSLDVPTGFDAATGLLREPHVRADATLTIAAPKQGLADCHAAGEIYVADISVPLAIYRDLGVVSPERLFDGRWVVSVESPPDLRLG